MPKDNIFDLTKQTPKTKFVKRKPEISKEEQEKLLQGYIQIPEEQWGNVKKYWHIRYERNGGQFRRGGFVNTVWRSTNKDGKEKLFIKLVTKPYEAPNKDTNPYWVLQLAEVSKIWRRITNSEKNTNSSSNMEALKLEIQELRDKQNRILALIKKLHGIQG